MIPLRLNKNTFRKTVKKYYFPVFLILGAFVYFLQRLTTALPELVNNHLNDFLCMPIVLKIGLYSVRYVKSDRRLKLPLLLQVLVTLVFIIYFEGVLPNATERYTADVLDILAYTLGLLFFMGMEGFETRKYA